MNKDVVIYEKEDIDKLLEVLNTTPISGIPNLRLITDISNIVVKGTLQKVTVAENTENNIPYNDTVAAEEVD